MQQQIQSLGANLLTISPTGQFSGAVRGAAGGGTSLTYADAKAILTSPEITTIKNVSAEYSGRSQVVAGRNNTNTQIMGATPSYLEVRNVKIAEGAFISDRDLTFACKSCSHWTDYCNGPIWARDKSNWTKNKNRGANIYHHRNNTIQGRQRIFKIKMI